MILRIEPELLKLLGVSFVIVVLKVHLYVAIVLIKKLAEGALAHGAGQVVALSYFVFFLCWDNLHRVTLRSALLVDNLFHGKYGEMRRAMDEFVKDRQDCTTGFLTILLTTGTLFEGKRCFGG